MIVVARPVALLFAGVARQWRGRTTPQYPRALGMGCTSRREKRESEPKDCCAAEGQMSRPTPAMLRMVTASPMCAELCRSAELASCSARVQPSQG